MASSSEMWLTSSVRPSVQRRVFARTPALQGRSRQGMSERHALANELAHGLRSLAESGEGLERFRGYVEKAGRDPNGMVKADCLNLSTRSVNGAGWTRGF